MPTVFTAHSSAEGSDGDNSFLASDLFDVCIEFQFPDFLAGVLLIKLRINDPVYGG